MEQMYRGVAPPFLTNWPIRPRQVPDHAHYILPKAPCSPSGVAFDHDDLPKLVAVHSLSCSPSHVISQLQRANVHPALPRGAIGGASTPVQKVTNINNINITVNTTKNSIEESTSQTTPIKKPEVPTPIVATTNKEPTSIPNKTSEEKLRTLVNTIKNTILKVQELRTTFYAQPKGRAKRKVLDELLAEREKLQVMQEVMKSFQNAKNKAAHIDSHTSTVARSNEAVLLRENFNNNVTESVNTSTSQVPMSTESNKIEVVQTHKVGALHTEHCLNDFKDHDIESGQLASRNEEVLDRMPSPARCFTSPSELLRTNDFEPIGRYHEKEITDNEHSRQESDVESDGGAADQEEDKEEPIITKYVRCAGILEERHEGDNFICDEWTVDIDTVTPHKATFRRSRKTSKPLQQEPDPDEPDFYQPPNKKPSAEFPDKLDVLSQGELSSCDEESDVDIFRLETPRENLHSGVMADGCCDDEIDEETEETLIKLGRQLQFRDAKITDLNQKKEKLMEELRRIKIKSRDS